MTRIDLNADIGEADNPVWAKAEEEILTAVSSANIACGGHAGNEETMRTTLRAAKKKDVSVGAHPAYPDRENFGRRSFQLGQDISAQALRETLSEQICRLIEIAKQEDVFVGYVKPHGALYNDAVNDGEKAHIICETIKTIDPNLSLLGGPRSEMLKAAETHEINFIAEGFIDRRYTDDGHLLSRTQEGAVLPTDDMRVAQALSLALHNQVTTNTGHTLTLQTRSLCLHGDSQGAVTTAHKARAALEAANVAIHPFLSPMTIRRSA